MSGTRRQFGSVRRLPSGRFQARYNAPDGLGRRVRTFKNKTDASRWLARIETEIDRGNWVDPQSGKVGITTYSAAWIRDRRIKGGRPLAARTVETYQESLSRWIAPYFGELPLTALSPAAIRVWHGKVERQGGPTAARQAYALLHAVLRTAEDDRSLGRNPCRIRGAGQAISPPQEQVLEADDVARLADAMPRHLYALVVVAYFAHLRHGELLGLQAGDVDLHLGRLKVARQVVEVANVPMVVPPKASSQRVIELPTAAVEALQIHLKESPALLPTARLFRRPNGSELRQHHVNAALRTARRTAGLPHATIHGLRHAGLTAVGRTGASLAEIMHRAGHSTVKAAMLYQHAATHRDALIAQRLSTMDWPSQGRAPTQQHQPNAEAR